MTPYACSRLHPCRGLTFPSGRCRRRLLSPFLNPPALGAPWPPTALADPMAEKAPELPRSCRVYKERRAIARAAYADAEADPRTNRSSSPVTGDSAWPANRQVFVGGSPRNLLVGCPVPLRSSRAPPWLGVGKDALATCSATSLVALKETRPFHAPGPGRTRLATCPPSGRSPVGCLRPRW
jgi:hypothetical protein